jgi:hypothetical protein
MLLLCQAGTPKNEGKNENKNEGKNKDKECTFIDEVKSIQECLLARK